MQCNMLALYSYLEVSGSFLTMMRWTFEAFLTAFETQKRTSLHLDEELVCGFSGSPRKLIKCDDVGHCRSGFEPNSCQLDCGGATTSPLDRNHHHPHVVVVPADKSDCVPVVGPLVIHVCGIDIEPAHFLGYSLSAYTSLTTRPSKFPIRPFFEFKQTSFGNLVFSH